MWVALVVRLRVRSSVLRGVAEKGRVGSAAVEPSVMESGVGAWRVGVSESGGARGVMGGSPSCGAVHAPPLLFD